MTIRRNRTRMVRCLNLLNRLRHNERGATAIEFAIVSIPFFAFLFMTLEVAFVYGGTVSLEHALDKSARKIRVGQPYTSLIDFKNEVCSHTVLLSDCATKLVVDVRTLANLSAAGGSNVMDNFTDGAGDLTPIDPDNPPGQYDPGNGQSIILVNAFYRWDVIARLPTFFDFRNGGALLNPLGNQSDGSRVISAAVAFKNEPF